MTDREAPSLLLFLPSLGGGGAERVLLHVGKGLADRGWGVTLATPRLSGEWLDSIPERFQVEALPGGRLRHSITALRAVLLARMPDAVLASPELGNLAVVAASLGRQSWPRGGPRLVLREAVSVVEYVRHAPLRERVLRDYLTRLAYRRADLVVTVSEGLRAEVMARCGLPPERVRTIPNPAHPPAASAGTGSASALGTPTPFLLAVGRLHAQKGFDTLIEAFVLTKASKTHQLVILGQGEERPRLEALIRRLGLTGRVHLPGFEPHPETYLASCDLFVLSSRFEGMPNVLLEAIQAGRPVVSTRCPHGPAELLEGSKVAHELVPPECPEALAGAIDRLLERTAREPASAGSLPEAFAPERVLDAYAEALHPPSANGTRGSWMRTLPQGSAEDLPLPSTAAGAVIVGRRPPPHGGVSVFVDRLAHHWSVHAAPPVHVVSPRRIPHLAWRMLWRRKEEYHLQSLRLPLLFLVAVTGALPRSWIYDHNHSRGIRAGSLRGLVLRGFLNTARGVRVASPEVENRLRAVGVDPDQLSTFIPFLPPPPEREPVTWPDPLSRWIHDPSLHVAVWSAWALVKEDGKDLYGAFEVAAAARKIAQARSDVRFLFVVGRSSHGGTFERAALRELRETPSAAVLEGGPPLWTLFPAVDLYLRTTTTDGDSISIREALHIGLPVVASDVAPRPQGVRCYAARNMEDLVQAILDVLPPAVGSSEARGRSDSPA